jgi:hypothetical protein
MLADHFLEWVGLSNIPGEKIISHSGLPSKELQFQETFRSSTLVPDC